MLAHVHTLAVPPEHNGVLSHIWTMLEVFSSQVIAATLQYTSSTAQGGGGSFKGRKLQER